MKTAIIFVAVLSVPAFAYSDTIYVPDDYAKIQEAIAAALPGDTVVVRPGTYSENIDFKGKGITVMSESGPAVTVIDGGGLGSVACFQSGEGADSVLTGFLLTNGSSLFGSGIFCKGASPTITCNEISSNGFMNNYPNTDIHGAGIYCRDGSPIIVENSIHGNYLYNFFSGDADGGGIYCENGNPVITGNDISGNDARSSDYIGGRGGGIFILDSSPWISENDIHSNSATQDLDGQAYGGGIYCENGSPVITQNVLTGNSCVCTDSGHGAGIYCCNSALEVLSNMIIGNHCSNGYGGGIALVEGSHAIIKGNDISENGAGGEDFGDFGGGGIYASDASLEVQENRINGNSAVVNGGGVFVENAPSLLLKENEISRNRISGYYGGRGGGVRLTGTTSPVIVNNTIASNKTGGHLGSIGGGVYCNGCPGAVFANNLIFDHFTLQGAGIYCVSSPASSFINNTLIGNKATHGGSGTGGGLRLGGGSYLIVNSILWNNEANSGAAVFVGGDASLEMSWNDVEGGQASLYVDPMGSLLWGPGMIDSDPLFVDPINDDFHIKFLSPCRGSGDNSAVTESYDFEGDPRICQGTVDIGADECYRHLYCMGDFTPGGSVEGKLVGLPGTTPVGLFIGSDKLPTPQPTMWGEFWLQAPWVMFGPLGSIPVDGVMILPTILPPGMTVPVDIPMQALIGLNPDSLTNLCMLEVR